MDSLTNSHELGNRSTSESRRDGRHATEPSCGPALDPRTERTLAAILDAGLELLIGTGPGAITHAQVAGLAKVSRTTIYKHFPSRTDLLRAIIQHFGADLPELAPTGDLRTDLGHVLTHIVDDLGDADRSRAFAAMMERSLHDPVTADVRDEFVAKGQAAMRQVLVNGRNNGVVRNDIHEDQLTAAIIGGLLFRRFMLGESVSMEAMDDVLDNAIALIAPPNQ